MDSKSCDLIMIVDSKDKIENLQQNITEFYASNNFRVNDPKSVSGGNVNFVHLPANPREHFF